MSGNVTIYRQQISDRGNVREIGMVLNLDRNFCTMDVQFAPPKARTHGPVYRYFDVPLATYSKLASSGGVGFHELVKVPGYRYELMEPAR